MICVDSNKHVIEINGEEVLREKREMAEERKELYHYCKLSTLNSILDSKCLLLNNIKNLHDCEDYEQKGIDENFLGCVFISCMTHCKNSKNLWDVFGDGGKGAKLTFKSNGVFHDEIFDKKKAIRAYSNNDELLYEFGFNISSIKSKQLFCMPNFSADIGITVDMILSDVIYSPSEPKSTFNINDNKYLNLSNVSRTVLQCLDDEFETRIIGILRSTKEVPIEDISYLLVPLNFDNFIFDIEYGKKVKEKDKPIFN